MIELNTNVRAAQRAREDLARRLESERPDYTPRDAHGDPEGEVYNPNHLRVHASLLMLVKQAGDYLERVYGGWLWRIEADQRGGVIRILSGRISPSYGLTIHIKDIQDDPELRVVKRLAGQMLERYGLPRKPFWKCQSEYVNAKRNVLGHLVPDLGDKRNNELMRRERLEQKLLIGRR